MINLADYPSSSPQEAQKSLEKLVQAHTRSDISVSEYRAIRDTLLQVINPPAKPKT